VIRSISRVGESIEVCRPSGADHLGDGVGPVRIDRRLGPQVDEDVGDLGAAASGRHPLDRSVGPHHVDQRDVPERRDGQIGQMLSALSLVQGVLHENPGLGEQLGGGLLAIQVDAQARHPEAGQVPGDHRRDGDCVLRRVDVPVPEDREDGEHEAEGSDHRRLRQGCAHRGDHRRDRQQSDQHRLPSGQPVQDRDRARHQHGDQRRT